MTDIRHADGRPKADREAEPASTEGVRLSACLIVKDEEERLPGCLQSVSFCDEVIVVDSGSSDRTVDIARSYGATVLEVPWRGFGGQRNVALDVARGEWALEVDADERITPRLREEIIALMHESSADVDNAVIPCRHLFLGRRLGPSANYPQCRTRLVRRDRYRHDETRTVHEGLWPQGRSVYPKGEIEHILANSMIESLRDLRAYSKLESLQVWQTEQFATRLKGVFVRPALKFAYRAFLLGGWRDGYPGFIKILLDCSYDSITWLRAWYASSQRPAKLPAARPPPEAGSHLGGAYGYSGPVRVIAIAHGLERTTIALAWLDQARLCGADVALISDVGAGTSDIRCVQVMPAGPLGYIRALEYEKQHNPVEVLLICGRRGRAIWRLLPRALQGLTDPVGPGERPGNAMSAAIARRPGETASGGRGTPQELLLDAPSELDVGFRGSGRPDSDERSGQAADSG